MCWGWGYLKYGVTKQTHHPDIFFVIWRILAMTGFTIKIAHLLAMNIKVVRKKAETEKSDLIQNYNVSHLEIQFHQIWI